MSSIKSACEQRLARRLWLGTQYRAAIGQSADLKLDVRSEVVRLGIFAATASESQCLLLAHHDTGRHQTYEPKFGSARVLLVEDDAAVRAATAMLLKVEGYA